MFVCISLFGSVSSGQCSFSLENLFLFEISVGFQAFSFFSMALYISSSIFSIFALSCLGNMWLEEQPDFDR